MKIETLEKAPRGTALIYQHGGPAQKVKFLGLHTDNPYPGRYVKKAMVRFPDGREDSCSVAYLRDPLNPELTPAQAKLLKESYQQGFVTSLSRETARSATANALIELGLALPAWTREYPGGPYKPTSVWGGQLTEPGRAVAERLIKEEG